MSDKHKQRLLPWLDNFDIGDELRDQIAGTLSYALSEAVAEERERCAKIVESFGGIYATRIAAKIREGA